MEPSADSSESLSGNPQTRENSLISNTSLFPVLLNAMPWCVWMKNSEGKIIFSNRQYDLFTAETSSYLPASLFLELEKKVWEEQKEKWVEISSGDSWFQIYIAPWHFAPENLNGVFGYIKNIGKEKRTLLDLLTEREYFQTLMDNIPDTIYFKDTQSRFTRINKSKAEELGLTDPKEANGKTDFDYFGPKEAQAAFEDEKKIFSSGVPLLDKEEKLYDLEGNEFWVSATKIPVHDETGNITGLVGISRNITDRIITSRKLEEAKKKAEESDLLKSAFLANMSHEIRSPMNGIIGFANLLRADYLSKEKREEYISHINSCSSTLLTLIDDIIDISKIEARQLKIVNTRFDLIPLLKDVLKTYDQIRQKQGKDQIRFFLNSGTTNDSFPIVADPNRLQQILINLIGNAFKFTQEGFIEFGFKHSGTFLTFYVKDTGIGIPEEKQAFVFDRFYQVEDAAALNKQGTGLGLAICANLVNLMGGEISLKSKPGEGSEFSFTIPYLASDNDPTLIPRKEKLNSPSTQWKGKTVLIAEDEPSNYLYLSELLKKTGINCLWVKNGEEALAAVKSNPEINIVLMDLKMPVMDGYEATRRLKALYPALPIIAQTAYAMSEEHIKSLKAGCEAYLTKPIHPESLYSLMQQYL